MEKGDLNTGDQNAYKITSHEKCRFHETTTTAGPGKSIMSLFGHGRLSSNTSLRRVGLTVGRSSPTRQEPTATVYAEAGAEWMHVLPSM
jgi:hypothetical protein